MFNCTLYTIGHGNRSADEFLQLLSQYTVKTLVDIRAYPHSQKFPHFEQEQLRQLLSKNKIVYHWAGRAFGGLRKARESTKHTALVNDVMCGFADHMDSDEFKRSAVQLVNLLCQDTTVLLCAEILPENCHRKLISDYFLLQNIEVIHLIDQDTARSHIFSSNARLESLELIYDRKTSTND